MGLKPVINILHFYAFSYNVHPYTIVLTAVYSNWNTAFGTVNEIPGTVSFFLFFNPEHDFFPCLAVKCDTLLLTPVHAWKAWDWFKKFQYVTLRWKFCQNLSRTHFVQSMVLMISRGYRKSRQTNLVGKRRQYYSDRLKCMQRYLAIYTGWDQERVHIEAHVHMHACPCWKL